MVSFKQSQSQIRIDLLCPVFHPSWLAIHVVQRNSVVELASAASPAKVSESAFFGRKDNSLAATADVLV